MKRFILILFFYCSFAGSNAQADNISFCLQGLSIHPNNQHALEDQYDRRLDSHGNFVITPGLLINYDMAVSGEWFTHVRFTGSYIDDCAKLPSGYIGAGVIWPMVSGKSFSVNICLGGGFFCRKDWRSRIDNYYSPVMQQAGPIEWIIAPFPEIELLIHPWDFQGSLVISFSTALYVSQLCAGFQLNF